jgi:hypothetical protein
MAELQRKWIVAVTSYHQRMLPALLFMASSYALLFGIWAPSQDTDNGSRSNTRQMFGIVAELLGLTWLADVVSLVINWNNGHAYTS